MIARRASRRSPGGGPASPLVIFGASLVLDLDSRFVTEAAGTCSAMQDQSGNGNNCTAATQPAYSAAGGVKGLPKLSFTGTQSFTSPTSPVAAGSARTVYAVATPTTVAGQITLFTNCRATHYCTFQGTQGDQGIVYSDGFSVNAGLVQSGAQMPKAGVHLYCFKVTDFANTTPLIVMVDNVSLVMHAGVDPANSDTGSAGYQAFSNSFAQGWKGDGYRILEVAGVTTAAQDSSVHAYCQWLYGTP